MNWLTWYNIHSGNRTTRAHLAQSFSATRTLCGWSISTLTSPAPRALPRCKGCLEAKAKLKDVDRGAGPSSGQWKELR